MPKDFLPFAQPDLDESELEQIREVLLSGWVTTGAKTRRFEAEFAKAVDAKHAVAVNSCTAAMHLSLEAVNLQRDDEVITSPYTFAATAEVIRYLDAKPVLVDICAADFNLNTDLIEAAITPRTKAIIPVHIAGLAAEMDAIYAIAQRHGLAVIEDAAHAFPAQYGTRKIGASPPADYSLQHAACFSFYATKTITTGEGGMICTDSDMLADRCRIMALHGISRNAWNRYAAEGSWYYEILAPGFKYNLTDIAAAMGVAQLNKAQRMWERRQLIAHAYQRAFAPVSALEAPPAPCAEDRQHAWHLYMLRLNLESLRLSRAQFIEELNRRGIGASVHFIPLHLHPYYRQKYGYQHEDFPVAYREYQREISLPIYSKMTDGDVQRVIDTVLSIVDEFCH